RCGEFADKGETAGCPRARGSCQHGSCWRVPLIGCMADRNVCPTCVMARMSPGRAGLLVAAVCCAVGTGCIALPDRIVEPQFHNPLPQIHRVAVLPFFNQSAEPTVNGEAVAIAYYNELQLIPGFEVMPVGVAK